MITTLCPSTHTLKKINHPYLFHPPFIRNNNATGMTFLAQMTQSNNMEM